jgi:signal transduction histidine kinase
MALNNICSRCSACHCKRSKTGKHEECSYGFNHFNSGTRIYFGYLVTDEKNMSKQKRKRLFEMPECSINSTVLNNIIERDQNIANDIQDFTSQEKARILADYIKNNRFRDDFLEGIKQDLKRNFSFLHDYKQISDTIRRNINVVIIEKTNCRGREIDESILSQCSHSEVAIYYASQILGEKLTTAKALQDSEWLYRSSENVKFRVHGCVIKYLRMYKGVSDIKHLRFSITGHSEIEILKNPKAFSIIPHTLIDNAIKYSPVREPIKVYINDEADYVTLSVTSFGPLIKKDEYEKIFLPFYRSETAKALDEDGSGFGLYVAQKIALEHLNTAIQVDQESTQHSPGFYETTFSINIPANS